MSTRVKLKFEPSLLTGNIERLDLQNCWFLLPSGVSSIDDVAFQILRSFSLQGTCPNGLTLKLDDCSLPLWQPVTLLRDGDCISVCKKSNDGDKTKKIGGSEEGRLKALTFPEASTAGAKNALHKMSFGNSLEIPPEEGGYESDDEVAEDGEENDDDEDIGSEDILYGSRSIGTLEVAKKGRKHSAGKKRKKIRDSGLLDSGKRLKKEMKVEDAGKKEGKDKVKSLKVESKKKGKLENAVKRKKAKVSKKKQDDRDGKRQRLEGKAEEVCVGLSTSSESNDTQEQVKPQVEPQVEDKSKKRKKREGPSRSAIRKKAKKLWLRKQAEEAKAKELSAKMADAVANSTSVINSKTADVDKSKFHVRYDEEGHGIPVPRPQVPEVNFKSVPSKRHGQAWGQQRHAGDTWQGQHAKGRNSSPSSSFGATGANQQALGQRAKADEEASRKQEGGDQEAYGKLPPLTRDPQVGDVLVYRLVELSASWTPELSNLREGQVASYNSSCREVVLSPTEKTKAAVEESAAGTETVAGEEGGEEGEDEAPFQFQFPYEPDGTLKADLLSLTDIRLLTEAPPGGEPALADQPKTPTNTPLPSSSGGGDDSLSLGIQVTGATFLPAVTRPLDVELTAPPNTPQGSVQLGGATWRSEDLQKLMKEEIEGRGGESMTVDGKREEPPREEERGEETKEETGEEVSGTAAENGGEGNVVSTWQQWADIADITQEIEKRRLQLQTEGDDVTPKTDAIADATPAVEGTPGEKKVTKETTAAGSSSGKKKNASPRRTWRAAGVGATLALLRAQPQ